MQDRIQGLGQDAIEILVPAHVPFHESNRRVLALAPAQDLKADPLESLAPDSRRVEPVMDRLAIEPANVSAPRPRETESSPRLLLGQELGKALADHRAGEHASGTSHARDLRYGLFD